MKHLSTLFTPMLAVLLFATTAQAQSGPPSDDDKGKPRSEAGGAAAAESQGSEKKIYRVRDANNNIVFTDEPPKGSDAEQVKLKKGNAVSLEPAPEVRLPRDDDKHKPVEYKVKLLSPADEKTFQHPTEPIPIEFKVTPALKEGHEVRVMHNGKPLAKPRLQWPVRGTHKIQVRVVNADGETISESDSHTLYVHRPSKKLP